MQKWEYLNIHVEFSKGRLVAFANGEAIIGAKDSAVEADLIRYLNSLGAEGWEMVNADRNEYGFQNYFFKRPLE